MKYYALQNTNTGGYFTGGMKLCHPPIYLTSTEQQHAQPRQRRDAVWQQGELVFRGIQLGQLAHPLPRKVRRQGAEAAAADIEPLHPRDPRRVSLGEEAHAPVRGGGQVVVKLRLTSDAPPAELLPGRALAAPHREEQQQSHQPRQLPAVPRTLVRRPACRVEQRHPYGSPPQPAAGKPTPCHPASTAVPGDLGALRDTRMVILWVG